MSERLIQASAFKATCLALLDEVADEGVEYVVTKRGRPVARLVPIDDDGPIFSSVRVVDLDDDLESTGESWSADADG